MRGVMPDDAVGCHLLCTCFHSLHEFVLAAWRAVRAPSQLFLHTMLPLAWA